MSRKGSSGIRQTLILSNIRRLITPSGRTKSGFLSDQALNSKALLVAVTETWLTSSILDSEVTRDFPGYSIFRCDRDPRQGGGVALYVREDLASDIICSYDNGVCELLAVMIYQLNTVAVVIYRPPDTRLNEFSEILLKLDDTLEILSSPTPTVVLMGDFNFSKQCIAWSRPHGIETDLVPIVQNHREGEVSNGKQDRLQASKFCDLAVKHSLIQQIDQPTHGNEILDLVLTNNCDLINSFHAESWPAFSDHKLVTIDVSYKFGFPNKTAESHLLDSGRRLKCLNFNKKIWPEIQLQD